MFDNEKRAGVWIREFVETHKYFVQYILTFIVLFTYLLFYQFTIHHDCMVDRRITMVEFLKYKPTLVQTEMFRLHLENHCIPKF